MPEPVIDFTRIKFPSDRLTVKSLREVWPSAFDIEPPAQASKASISKDREYRRTSIDGILGEGVIDVERELAERAFKLALGRSIERESRLRDKDRMLECLSDEYVRFGLAAGQHEAALLIRRIESQAEAQARALGGRRRS